MTNSILAIETCSESCSVALLYKGHQSQLMSDEPRGHADNILPMVDQLLAEAELELTNLDAIAFTRGPGAFTGVRIGTSVAQGLSMATEIPLIAVSSLAVLAQGSFRISGNPYCLAALDARMSEVYFGVYQLAANNLMTAMQDDQVAAPENLLIACEAKQIDEQVSWHGLGAGWINYSEQMANRFGPWSIERPSEIINPQAKDLLTLAQWHYTNGDILDAAEALPIYVRDQVVRT